MCKSTFTKTYLLLHTCTHMCKSIFIYTFLLLHTCTHTNIDLQIDLHIYVIYNTYEHIHVCMCESMCVFLCMFFVCLHMCYI